MFPKLDVQTLAASCLLNLRSRLGLMKRTPLSRTAPQFVWCVRRVNAGTFVGSLLKPLLIGTLDGSTFATSDVCDGL